MASQGSGSLLRRAAGLALLAVCLVPLAFATAAPLPGPCAAAAYPIERWVDIKAPPFPSGSDTISDYVVAAYDPARLYITNGRVVMTSVDGGCHWKSSLTLVPVPGETVGQVITHLSMGVRDPDTVYASLGSGLLSKPSVMRTSNGGQSWQTVDRGLELVQGRPIQLTAAPGDPRTAYLVVEGNRISQGDKAVSVVRSLYATTDGATWSERKASPLLVEGEVRPITGGPAVGGNGGFEGVAVDPLNSRVVYLYGRFGLWRSTDGAVTSQELVPPRRDGGPIGAVDLYHDADVNRILAFDSLTQRAYVSFNGGRKFHIIPTPGILRSAATGRTFAELVVATDSRIFYLPDPSLPSRQITPPGPVAQDLEVALGTTPSFYARTAKGLLRWTAGVRKSAPGGGPLIPLVPGKPGQVVVPQLPALPTARLQGLSTVSLPAGGSRTVPYTVVLPGVQRVDLYFLVDVSDSMSQEIDGLRSALAGIITELVASNIDAYFGVGRYNTYDTEPYFRLAPVAAPGPSLARALRDLAASGGGEQKSQLEAVQQSVSGAGLERGDIYIAPGQQAGFRAEAPVKLILNVTDEGFYEGPPSPTYDAVAASLRKQGVKQVGLALRSNDILPSLGPGPEVGLRRLAIGSGALAPPGGVDCDGDATADIPGGDALVCVLPSERSSEATLLANAIVSLVRSLPNTGVVSFAVRSANAAAPVPQLSTQTFPVDFKTTSQRSLEVTYTCPRALVPAEYGYHVGVQANGAEVAGVDTVLQCGALPAAAALFVPALPPQVGAAVAPPVQPPPISNANPNPNPNPQSQPQAQAQGAPQAAMATQEETQPQLAYAYINPARAAAQTATDPSGKLDHYSMSRYVEAPTDAPRQLIGGLAVLSMGAAYAVSVAARARTRPAVARARRRG